MILAETGVSVFSSLFENFWVVLLLKTVAVMGFFLVVPLGVGYVEHKGLAHMQARLGPMEAGAFHGWAQLVADGVKFIQKEDVIPAAADRHVFSLAPAVAMIPYIAILVVLPISDSWFAENLDVGIFFVLAMSSVSVIGVMMAGWSSANKFSLIGALRAAAQLIAYELPLVIAAAAVVMQAGTLSMIGIVEAQHSLWFIIPQLPGFLIFMMAAFAELQRPPFDMPIADSEIIFGAYTEYTGLKFAFFLLAEYGGIVAFSGIASRAVPGRLPAAAGHPDPGPVDDDGQDRRARLLLHLAPGHVSAAARGPAPAVLLAGVDPAVVGPDHGRGRGEGGVLDGRADAEASGTGLGLAKGLSVTLKTMLQPAVTQQYPRVKPDLPPRTRGVIALKEANCTVCYKCSRECPDWCIYIDAHKETHDPAGGGRARSQKVLDRFAIDYALCMYCGICVEVCPFDALFWSPEFEYGEYDIDLMTHEKERLEEWTYTVLPPPALEDGAVPTEEQAS